MLANDLLVTYNELFERAQCVRKRMADAGQDALLLTTGDNLRYLSGYPSPARSGPRPFIFILPQSGDPTFIVHAGREVEAHRFSWAKDIRTYYPLSHAPVDLIAETLREKGLENSRIGIEMGAEQCLDIPLVDFFKLREKMLRLSFQDSAPVLWPARIHKTPMEIERLRLACSITSLAIEYCFQNSHMGMSEREIAQIVINRMLELGAQDPRVLMTSGLGNYDMVSRRPSTRILETGDMLYMDLGCAIEGYSCDFDRTGVVGGPSQQQLDAQQVALEVTQLGVEMVRPGTNTREIAQACKAALTKFPYPITSDIGYLAARIGHGIGLTVVEPPNIAEYENTVLEAGMVITIEPGVATEFGVFHIEQDVLVTDSGYEILSIAPCHIRSIPN